MAEGFGLSNASFGFDVGGVTNYLKDLKSIAVSDASEAVLDIAEIETAVDSNWAGQAASDFKTALSTEVKDISGKLNDLYETLESQINQLADSMADFDNNLMSQINNQQ